MNNKAVIMCVEGINNLNNNIKMVEEDDKKRIINRNTRSEIMIPPLTIFYVCQAIYMFLHAEVIV